MSQHFYADGATHNDHHKEINIGSVTSNDLKDIVKGFFKDDDVEDAEVIEDNTEAETPSISPEQIHGEDNCSSSHDSIPLDCLAAVTKVVIPTFTIEGGVVLTSQVQIRKAAMVIDLKSNSEVAMLMAVCFEVGAIRLGTTCPDFVRMLIGLEVIAYTNDAAIDKMAGGMTKKLNGYTRKRNGEVKKYQALPARHLQWSTNDRPMGIKINDALRMQG